MHMQHTTSFACSDACLFGQGGKGKNGKGKKGKGWGRQPVCCKYRNTPLLKSSLESSAARLGLQAQLSHMHGAGRIDPI